MSDRKLLTEAYLVDKPEEGSEILVGFACGGSSAEGITAPVAGLGEL
jgi:hypothetical protein